LLVWEGKNVGCTSDKRIRSAKEESSGLGRGNSWLRWRKFPGGVSLGKLTQEEKREGGYEKFSLCALHKKEGRGKVEIKRRSQWSINLKETECGPLGKLSFQTRRGSGEGRTNREPLALTGRS